ncbi:unnamed protein product [Adineta steineri]|uniref:Uncharacterized protein n=1 Tax=Adineta steineri TaxID=433720 RepID=A0A820FFC2_9BILA|nr:unnamed protein product [Adineta steineri]CAF4260242.1 unnamed protein product [Adineta steineri]
MVWHMGLIVKLHGMRIPNEPLKIIIVNLGIEWCNDLGDYDIPHTAIDFNHAHVPHLYWILIVEASESVLKRLNLDWNELIGFSKSIGENIF